MTRASRWIAAALLGTAFAAQVQSQEPVSEEPVVEEVAMEEAAMPASDLVSVLDADGRFTVLVGALQSTDLVATLQGEGPFTLFAPTDEAFAGLPEGTLEVLTPEQLQAVLLYHVVSGAVDGAAAGAAGEAATVGGQPLTFTQGDDGLRVNEALVTEGDLAASNGLVHVIDAVLMPPPSGEPGDAPDEELGDGSDAESGPDDGP